MKTVYSNWRVLLFFIGFHSCSDNITSSEIPDEFTFGNSFSAEIIQVDEVLSDPAVEGRTLDYDIDMDGTADFRFSFLTDTNQFVLYRPGFSLQSLHSNLEFNGVLTDDTTFLSIETRIEVNQLQDVIQKTFRTYSCHRLTPLDEIIEIVENKIELITYGFGDKLESSSKFSADSILFVNADYTLPRIDVIENDTMFYEYTQVLNNCRNFPRNELAYVGIRQNNRLGWIKLGVFGSREVLILEMALEK